MIKVLLADADKGFLTCFSKLIDWHRYGFHVIAEAFDGEKAFDVFVKLQPEVVIAGIDMPGLSGIALARKINEGSPGTVIVFLSGDGDFSCTHAVLALKVFDYIAKLDIEKDRLAEMLVRIKAQINKMKIYQKYLLAGALSACLETGKPVPEEHETIFPGRYDFLLAVQNHVMPVIADAIGTNKEELPESKLREACALASEDFLATVKIKNYVHIVLFKQSVGRDCYARANALRERLESNFDQSFSVVILGENSTFKTGFQAYAALKDSLERIYFYPASTVVHGSLLQTGTVYQEDLTPIAAAIKENELHKILVLMDKYYSRAIQAKHYPYFSALTALLITKLLSYHLRIEDMSTGNYFILYDESSFMFWQDALSVFQWTKQQFLRLKDCQNQRLMPEYPALVNAVLSFIIENLDNADLSIETIAKHFQLSVGKLNDLFKKETGYTIRHIITTIKMTSAKNLIEQSVLKVNDICHKTGYTSLSYFSKVFKKTYGVSPLDYRRRKRIEAELFNINH